MILQQAIGNPRLETCPHTRGDDPDYCTRFYQGQQLVPIRVGMILKSNVEPLDIFTCPHTRGDDPCVTDSL